MYKSSFFGIAFYCLRNAIAKNIPFFQSLILFGKIHHFTALSIKHLYVNPLRTKGGSNLTPPLKNGFFNSRFFHVFKRNLEKKLNLYINTIHILHLVCFLCILELHQLNYDWVSKHSENHLKRVGTERVKMQKIIK